MVQSETLYSRCARLPDTELPSDPELDETGRTSSWSFDRAAVFMVCLAVLALFVPQLTQDRSPASIRFDGHESEASLRQSLAAFRRILVQAIEARAQRDALLLEQAGRRHENWSAPGSSFLKPSFGGTSAREASAEQQPGGVPIGRSNPYRAVSVERSRSMHPQHQAVTVGLNAVLSARLAELIAAARAEGIELRVVGGLQGIERPSMSFAAERAALSQASHGAGLAFDIAVLKNGRMDFAPSPELARAGAIGKSLGLRWGGDSAYSRAWFHFEVPAVN